MNTVQGLLSLAANLERSLHKLDVKNVFLQGDLEEEVYMEYLQVLERERKAWKEGCFKLKKSLHGLKQSLRARKEKFMKSVHKLGYVQS